jgi:uncharacterized cupredoxin-like copper-binding protein
MKKRSLLWMVVLGALVSGCVSTTYTKSISVTKDATGNVIQTVETETVMQPNQQGWPVKFEHLKGVQPNGPK